MGTGVRWPHFTMDEFGRYVGLVELYKTQVQDALRLGIENERSYEPQRAMLERSIRQLEQTMQKLGYTADPAAYARDAWEQQSETFLDAFKHFIALGPAGKHFVALNWDFEDDKVQLVFSPEVDISTLGDISFEDVFGDTIVCTYELETDPAFDEVVVNLRVLSVDSITPSALGR